MKQDLPAGRRDPQSSRPAWNANQLAIHLRPQVDRPALMLHPILDPIDQDFAAVVEW